MFGSEGISPAASGLTPYAMDWLDVLPSVRAKFLSAVASGAHPIAAQGSLKLEPGAAMLWAYSLLDALKD
jgi:hypothetical protein